MNWVISVRPIMRHHIEIDVSEHSTDRCGDSQKGLETNLKMIPDSIVTNHIGAAVADCQIGELKDSKNRFRPSSGFLITKNCSVYLRAFDGTDTVLSSGYRPKLLRADFDSIGPSSDLRDLSLKTRLSHHLNHVIIHQCARWKVRDKLYIWRKELRSSSTCYGSLKHVNCRKTE
jgi:hypothetical protein